MFNDSLVKIYSSPDSASYIKSIYADFQPYTKSIVFEDGFQIDITNRLFCDTDSSINKDSYFEIEGEKYKVMDLKKWDDHFEVYLYKLKRQV
ncbi:hypothetical protein A7D23_15180 [Dehalobacter sp. TeCB1]|nr:hypothetical protein A7D23_15180 [Dehalobacter sp. TeCB1]